MADADADRCAECDLAHLPACAGPCGDDPPARFERRRRSLYAAAQAGWPAKVPTEVLADPAGPIAAAKARRERRNGERALRSGQWPVAGGQEERDCGCSGQLPVVGGQERKPEAPGGPLTTES